MRFTMKNGWLAFSLLAAACAGAVARPVLFPAVSAEPGAERCEYRYLLEAGKPNIPDSAVDEPMGGQWAALGQAGYHVAAMDGGFYLFERCLAAK
jgi:hypothetical protein